MRQKRGHMRPTQFSDQSVNNSRKKKKKKQEKEKKEKSCRYKRVHRKRLKKISVLADFRFYRPCVISLSARYGTAHAEILRSCLF